MNLFISPNYNTTIMKRMHITNIMALFAAVFFISSCGNEQAQDQHHMDHDAAMHEETMGAADHTDHMGATTGASTMEMEHMEAPEAFREELAGVYEAYQALKDALVATDDAAAADAANSMHRALSAVDGSSLSGKAEDYWQARADKMNASLETMGAAADIEGMRMAFSAMTMPMQEALASFEANPRTLYIQHCPMAFNNTGASWISDEEQISNPYFGDKMLRCGSVQGRIELP